jgi:hypothetical protein
MLYFTTSKRQTMQDVIYLQFVIKTL